MAPGLDRIVITGANGWVGRTALSLAARWWGEDASEKVTAFGSTEAEIDLDGRRFKVLPLAALSPSHVEGAIVLHLAFLTKDRLAFQSGDVFLARNAAIDTIVLEATRQGTPRGMFVASSGAARLVEQGGGDLYGLAKLIQERRFAELAETMPGSILRGRIWSLAGPHMNKPEAYALADFLVQGRKTGQIHITAAQPVYRSYLHVEDVVTTVFSTLTAKSAPSAVIDLAGAEIVEIQDVAAAVALALGLSPDCISRAPVSLDRRNVYVGDWASFRELALACNVTPRSFTNQVADTLAYFDRTAC